MVLFGFALFLFFVTSQSAIPGPDFDPNLPSDPSSCTVVDKFVGVDSGNVVLVSFTYDIAVVSGTSQSHFQRIVLPALEQAMMEQSAPLILKACAPQTKDTSGYADIVGIESAPRDVVSGNCTMRKLTCFAVASKTSLYVKSTSKGASTAYLAAIKSLLSINNKILTNNNDVDTLVIKMENIRNVVTFPDPSTERDKTLLEKTAALQVESPVAFWTIIVAIVIVIAVIIIGICVCCCHVQMSI